MDTALSLLKCTVRYEAFLVGIHCDTGNVAIYPENAPITADQVSEDLHESSPTLARYPEEEHFKVKDEWDKAFSEHRASSFKAFQRVHAAIDEYIDKKEWLFLMSEMAQVNGYVVTIAVLMNLEDYARYDYASLNKEIVLDSMGKVPSLLYGAFTGVLHSYAKELEKRQPGKNTQTFKIDARECLRFLAAYLTRLHHIGVPNWEDAVGMGRASYFLFDACNAVAGMRIEGEEPRGKLLIREKDHPGSAHHVKFKTPILLSNHKAFRKLLHMCTDDISVLSDGGKIHGLGRWTPNNTHPDKYCRFSLATFVLLCLETKGVMVRHLIMES